MVKSKKNIFIIALCAVMFLCVSLIVTFSSMQKIAFAESVSYIDENGDTQSTESYTEINADSADPATWNGTVCVTSDVTLSGGVTLSDDTLLILSDGFTLTVENGIKCGDSTLTICSQINDSGALKVTGKKGSSSVGEPGISGNVVINGGKIDIKGGKGPNGGNKKSGFNGGNGITGSVIVNGGKVNIIGGDGGNKGTDAKKAGIGGIGVFGNVVITDGIASITGGNSGSGTGEPINVGLAGGDITISGDGIATLMGGGKVGTDTLSKPYDYNTVTTIEASYIEARHIDSDFFEWKEGGASLWVYDIVRLATYKPHIHDDVRFLPWDGGTEHDSLPTKIGGYYLTNDITLSSPWLFINSNIDICLNGHVITINDNEVSVITVQDGVTLNLYDCDKTTVHNGYIDEKGLWHLDAESSHVLLEKETEKSITGGIITGGKKTKSASYLGGGGVTVKGTLNMYGGTIAGNTSVYGGGISVDTGTFVMNGGEISYNCASDDNAGGGIYTYKSSVILNDGTISNNFAYCGGGIYIGTDSTVTMNGGTIASNKATDDGGGIYNNNLLTLNGGLISENSSYFGGGVFNNQNGTFTMKDGLISKNIAPYTAGVYNKDTFVMVGGEISENAIGVSHYGTALSLGGSAAIINNIENSVAQNLYLSKSASSGPYRTITFETGENAPITTGENKMNVGITLAVGTGDFATGVLTADYLGCFTIDYSQANIKLKATAVGESPIAYTYSLIHEHEEDGIDFQMWTQNELLPSAAGNWFLNCDVTLPSTWTVPEGTTNLCLNGHVINANGGNFSVITIGADSTLNIYDCGTIVHNGYVDEKGLWNLDAESSHVLLEKETEKSIIGGIITGGKILGDYANTNGGGVYIGENGVFSINGGTIIGNTADSGAGVYNNGTFVMNGGEISYNRANSAGGVDNNKSFNMTGGSINNNISSLTGGVYNLDTFVMVGGEIINNKASATNGNGGVGHFGTTLSLGGSAVIIDNMQKSETNNLYLSKTSDFVSYKTISFATGKAPITTGENKMNVGITLAGDAGDFAINVSTADYLSCFSMDYPQVDMKLKATAVGESPTTYTYSIVHTHEEDSVDFNKWTKTDSLPTVAGNYYLISDITLTETWTVPEGITNLCLKGYVINANGGAFSVITIGADSTLNLYDCGTTEHNGYIDADGLWHLGTGVGTAKSITGGIITGGNITTNGGGVNVSGTFNMYGGNIAGNTAQNGGGVSNIKSFTMTGGNIIGNTATQCGGGVYASSLIFVNILTGGTITDNTAQNGGGVYYKVEECFAPGTLITMADGTTQKIETLKIGDSVRVFDHEKGGISSSEIFDVWTYPEKHSGQVKLHFSNDINITVVYGHSFFEREQNKYVAVTKDNVSAFIGHEFYNVDKARWETLEGYEFIDGEVDTYVITTKYQLNCVANGMLSNEDGFYTLLTNIFEYGDNLEIDQVKKAQDVAKFGLYDYENIKHMSKYVYDVLNFQYLKVAFGKGLITEDEFNYLESYYAEVDPELYCVEKEETPVESKSILLMAPLKAPLLTSSVAAPTAGFYVGGSIKILGNNSGNLYISSGKTITIGTGTVGDGNGVVAPTEDMNIGITLQSGTGDFATDVSTADYLDCFTIDDSQANIKLKATAVGESPTTYTYSLIHEHEEDGINFQMWTQNDSLPTVAGNYYLISDITLSSTWTVPEGTTNLCLNGHVINANGGNFSVITIGADSTLNLYDCGTTEHNGYVDSTGLWHLGTGEGTEKIITGGIITGGKATTNGGGVNVTGTFNMYGGNIAGNVTSKLGAGICVTDGTFNLFGGSINYNVASSGGGGVCITKKSSSPSFTMTGGSINNNVGLLGGGVQASGGTFTMTGGSIDHNTAQNYGGGIFIGSVTTIFGGSAIITDNTSGAAGSKVTSNIYIPKGKTITLCTGDDAPTTMSVGVTLFDQSKKINIPGAFTTTGTADYSANFFSDNENYGICFNAGTETDGDEYLELKQKVKFDEEYEWNNGESISYGESYSETAPKVFYENTEVTGLGFIYTYYQLGDDGSWIELDSKPSDIGSYKVIISVASNDTYVGAEEYLFAIIRGTLVDSTIDVSLTYDGEDHANLEEIEKVIIIKDENGNVITPLEKKYSVDGEHYALGTEIDWSEINAINVGEYVMYYEYTYATYNTVSDSFTLTITRAEQVINIKADISKIYDANWVYFNEYSSDVLTKLGDGAVTKEYKVKDAEDSTYTTDAPINAGTYVIRISVAEGTNYLAGSATKEFTISKAEISRIGFNDVVQPVAKEEAPLAVSGIAIGARYAGVVSWSPALVEGKFDYNTKYTVTLTLEIVPSSIDSYKFKDGVILVKPKNAGWTLSKDSTESKLIYTKEFEKTAKTPQVIEIEDPSKIYDGTAVSLVDKYTKLGDGAVTIEYKLKDAEDSTYTTEAPINAGSYVVKVSVVEGTNYAAGSETLEFTISQKAITVTIVSKTGIYGDEIVELTATDDGIISGDKNVYSLSTTASKTSDVGTYNIVGETLCNNYLISFEGGENAYTISQREITIIWEKTKLPYNNQNQVPTPTAGNLANDDEVTFTIIGEQKEVGNSYVATITELLDENYKLPETNLTTDFEIIKADYDMSGITFSDKSVKITDSDADKKIEITGTLPIGFDGIGLTVSYENNDNKDRGKYLVTAIFSTTSPNYNVPDEMTAILTILWVRDSEKDKGSDEELVIVTSDTGIDPSLFLKVDVVQLDDNNNQYNKVTESVKKESSYNSNLDKIFGVYDVSLLNQDDIKVQPDGTIKVYMTIPEEIVNCGFRIYHVHNGVAKKVEYVIEDGYAVVETDELSEFVFVYEQTSLLAWIIVLSILLALGLIVMILLIVKTKKNKQGRK